MQLALHARFAFGLRHDAADGKAMTHGVIMGYWLTSRRGGVLGNDGGVRGVLFRVVNRSGLLVPQVNARLVPNVHRKLFEIQRV